MSTSINILHKIGNIGRNLIITLISLNLIGIPTLRAEIAIQARSTKDPGLFNTTDPMNRLSSTLRKKIVLLQCFSTIEDCMTNAGFSKEELVELDGFYKNWKKNQPIEIVNAFDKEITKLNSKSQVSEVNENIAFLISSEASIGTAFVIMLPLILGIIGIYMKTPDEMERERNEAKIELKMDHQACIDEVIKLIPLAKIEDLSPNSIDSSNPSFNSMLEKINTDRMKLRSDAISKNCN